MVAVLKLTPEEDENVREGYLNEPSYRPFPIGQRGRLEREEEVRAETEEREHEAFPELRWDTIERRLAAQVWKRSTFDVPLLVSEATQNGRPREIIAIGRATSGPRATGYPGARLVSFGPWSLLEDPISLNSVHDRMGSARSRMTMGRILDEPCRPLPSATAGALLNALGACARTLG
jgi:hypothetical protein